MAGHHGRQAGWTKPRLTRMVSDRRNGRHESTGGLLFTAFEPSGDYLAAPVIETIRRQEPHIPIWGFGGPRMEAAGATLIERTTDHAVMMAGVAWQACRHHRRVHALKQWMARHPLAVHVPVDSPAANWSICRLVRRQACHARIVHLAAPQLWAWATWRVGRLRRLTDRVLCLLPFEPSWFAQRGIPSVFVGHPLFDDEGRPTDAIASPNLPRGTGLHLALLPGSRPQEIAANAPTMFEAWRRVRREHADLRTVIAVGDEDAASRVRACMPPATPGVDMPEVRVGETGAVLGWCDVALVVSGTATLQAAAHRTPMVALFKLHWLSWHLVGRWVVRTRPLTLPNLIGRACGLGEVIEELVPHVGGAMPVYDAVQRLLSDADRRASQRAALDHVSGQFRGQRFAETAAALIVEMMGDGRRREAGEPSRCAEDAAI